MAKYQGFKAKCQGFSHIKSELPCQDAAGCYVDEKLAICVVSDGHGSEKYFRSDVGSEKAVAISLEAVKEFVGKQQAYIEEGKNSKNKANILSAANYGKTLQELAAFIVSRWIEQIEGHWAENERTDEENLLFGQHFTDDGNLNVTKIYGATLIIGVMSEAFNFVIQIGDGAACVIKRNGTKMIPAETVDESQFGGYTNSLSSSNCLSFFRFFYSRAPLKAIVVASDGVTDSYGDKGGADFLNFCGKLVELYSENYEQAQGFLEEWLPKLSEKGSQDDMSVAGVFALTEAVNGTASNGNDTDEGNNQEGLAGA